MSVRQGGVATVNLLLIDRGLFPVHEPTLRKALTVATQLRHLLLYGAKAARMNNITALLRKLFERRRADRREVYLVCATPVLFVTMLAGDEGLEAAIPYFVLLLICLVQFFRPMLIGWGLLTALFWAYAVVVALHPKNGPPGDFLIFLSLGLVPGVALLWCRPRSF